MQELGINDTIKLPRIVVLGDQSTGKSSLIEAISTIKVPKAANLCTKCPIAINLSSGPSTTSPWTCSVYIEERFTYDTAFKQKRVTKAHPLGPWHLSNDVKTTLVKTTHSREELCGLIELAQQAILNPGRNPGDPVNAASTGDLERFSPNTIRLDISVGGWPNLSFVDLPGVIQTAGRNQPDYYVQLVESLAEQYAQDENNIIMLTLPMNYDVSNSKSYSIIQKQQAQSRTMAVFTKVDLARDEERKDCLNRYFDDEAEEEFEHGHHMVMLSNTTADTELVQTEAVFFLSNPWGEMPDSIRARFGVANLTKLLRQILFEKTAETLPSNLEKIRERLELNEQQLANMPAPPDTTELPYQLRDQVKDFGTQIKQIFMSGHDVPGSNARTALNRLMHEFNGLIRGGKPTMLVKTESENVCLARAERKLQAGAGLNSVAPDVDTDGDAIAVSTTPHRQRQEANILSQPNRVKRFRLEEIREINNEYYQASVPGEIELKALETMNCLSVQYWDVTLMEFMQKISKTVKEHVLECVESHFGYQRHLQLYDKVQNVVEEYLDFVIREEWSGLKRACEVERKYPLTFDQESLKKHELESMAVRRQKRAEARLNIDQTKLKAANPGKKVKTLTFDDLKPDEWDVEVQMSAKSRAYYEIASSRFVDSICQNIFFYLIPRCQDSLVDHVRQELGLHNIRANRDQIALLMAEDAEREAYRARLRGEQARLVEGHDYIQKVLGSTNVPQLQINGHARIENPVDTAMSDEDTISASVVGGPAMTSTKRKADAYLNRADANTPSKRSRKATIDNDDSEIGVTTPTGQRDRLAHRFSSIPVSDDDE